MSAISADAIKRLFTEARTYTSWLPKGVSDEILHEIYELMKLGPTSANSCPIRIIFVKSVESKTKLLPCIATFNAEKVKTAPVTALLAYDEKFYEQMSRLFPHSPGMKDMLASDAALAEATAFRNSSLQGAYFMLAARALGLDCGPMSGFDSKALDTAFFSGTPWKSNFICNIGYGDPAQLKPRLPRLNFEEACKIL